MANAGYSADYQLCRRLAAARKYIKHYDEDDKLATILKNHVNDYVWINMIYAASDNCRDWNRIWSQACNVIITMNQLRQRNWYWTEIKE